MEKKPNIVVLGFYDRANLGDESYKLAFTRIFTDSASLTFHCTDDIGKLPTNTDIVIVGGGDVINDYFMTKVLKLTEDFQGPIYAFSVGIPYTLTGIKYLSEFDHVFVRNSSDYETACKHIGAKNTTLIDDACFVFSTEGWKKEKTIITTRKTVSKKIGVCLAQPLFHTNTYKQRLLAVLAEIIQEVAYGVKDEVHLFAFNTSNGVSESDVSLNIEFSERLQKSGINVYLHNDLTNAEDMLVGLDNMDVVLCSRFHSVVFSMIIGKPIVALYSSNKIAKLLKDNQQYQGCKFLCDSADKPIFIDKNEVVKLLKSVLDPKYTLSVYPGFDFSACKEMILSKKRKQIMYVATRLKDKTGVVAKCKTIFGLDNNNNNTNLTKGALTKDKVQALEYAHVISFLLTGSIQTPYIWGLVQNTMDDNFDLYDAVNYIHNDITKNKNKYVFYLPTIDYKNKAFVTFDDQRSSFEGLHRSGWAYSLGGMMHMNADLFGKKEQSILYLDTYVDRTFHWGNDALKSASHIPYKTAWMGIIHHTYDESYSTYNCVELFKNPVFIESLKNCKGLITLSNYLAVCIRKDLKIHGFTNVPVHVLCHPMEFVDKKWTLNSFLTNKNRKVVQIGAWLRNPYAIYELPLYPEYNNPLHITKYALKGPRMDNQFMTTQCMELLKDVLVQTQTSDTRTSCMCRNPNGVNKCTHGIYNSIVNNLNSVTVIEEMSNEEYDDLLSENVLFLNLIDCSAVNTVLEAIVRNTPIFVNRHPALEEVLGTLYPGFYRNLSEAAFMVADVNTIMKVNEYLSKLNKDKLHLESFVSSLDTIVHTYKMSK